MSSTSAPHSEGHVGTGVQAGVSSSAGVPLPFTERRPLLALAAVVIVLLLIAVLVGLGVGTVGAWVVAVLSVA